MKSSQQTRRKITAENIYLKSKYPGSDKQDYARKTARTPLGAIQDSADKKHYLSVEYGQQEKNGTRSKSLSFDIPPIEAESTRISPIPPLNQFITKCWPTVPVPVRLIRSESQKELLQRAPIKARSRPCRCLETQGYIRVSSEINQEEISSTINNQETSDDVFVQVRYRSESQKELLLQRAPIKATSTSCRCLETHGYIRVSSEINQEEISSTINNQETSDEVFLQPTLPKSRTQAKQSPTPSKIPMIKSVYKSQPQKGASDLNKILSTGTSTIHKARSTEKLSHRENSKSSTRNQRSGSVSTQLTAKLISSTERNAQNLTSKNFQIYSSSKKPTKSILWSSRGSENFIPAKKYQEYSSTKSSTSAKHDLSVEYIQTIVPSLEKQCSSSIESSKSKRSQNSPIPKRYQGCISTNTTTNSERDLVSQYLQTYTSSLCSSSIESSKSKRSQNSPIPKRYQGCISTNTTTNSERDLVSQYLQTYTSSKDYQRCNSTNSTTTSMQDPQGFTTLPVQKSFVTLSQETLDSTRCSDNYYMECILPLNNVQVIRDSSIFPEDEKTFVAAPKFFQDLEQGKKSILKTVQVCSPLNINVPVVRRSNSLSEGESGKRVKTTLRRKNSIRKVIICPLLHSPEYLEDIILYSYRQSNNFLLKSDWIETYMDRKYRTDTINWLLQVKELLLPNFDPVHYMAVRIFDYTVIRLRLRKRSYQLVAVVAFWISLKYLDNSVVLKVPKIHALCNGQYSKEEILQMERTILQSIGFALNMCDPLDFLHYYLKSSNLETHEILKYASKFVMECATLFENYPLVGAPFLAATALYLAYTTLINSKHVYVNFIWFDRKKVQKYAEDVLGLNVRYAAMKKYEPLNKYLTPEKLEVAKYFLNI